MNDAEYWKNVAVWLADCHAGTMEVEGRMSKTSKRSRERFRKICENAASMLVLSWPYCAKDNVDMNHVVERLRNASRNT